MTEDPYAGYHNAVSTELARQNRMGYNGVHDDAHGIDHLLGLAYKYAAQGSTVKAGAMIVAARMFLQRNKQNVMQVKIAEFMAACEQEVKKYPELPSEQIRDLRIALMREELEGENELIDSMLKGDLVGIADGLADVLYVVIGTAVAYGIDVQEVFDEVQRSNMTKATWNEEEKRYVTIRNELGKVLKPDTFSPANLAPIVERQIANGKAQEEFVASQFSVAEVTVGEVDI